MVLLWHYIPTVCKVKVIHENSCGHMSASVFEMFAFSCIIMLLDQHRRPYEWTWWGTSDLHGASAPLGVRRRLHVNGEDCSTCSLLPEALISSNKCVFCDIGVSADHWVVLLHQTVTWHWLMLKASCNCRGQIKMSQREIKDMNSKECFFFCKSRISASLNPHKVPVWRGMGGDSSFSSLPSSSLTVPLLSVSENAKEGLMKEINWLHGLRPIFTSLLH